MKLNKKEIIVKETKGEREKKKNKKQEIPAGVQQDVGYLSLHLVSG